MNYTIDEIKEITTGIFLKQNGQNNYINNVVYDSRKISYEGTSVFLALPGENNDGHKFIDDAYVKGIKNFIVDKEVDTNFGNDINVIKVESSLAALQKLASNHRGRFSYPVIGITGSNGKTMIKEWLAQALSQKQQIAKSPQSFNSQLGVCISLFQLDDNCDSAIIEAGISMNGEMSKLQKIIKPTIGIFSNIGDAHSSGFKNNLEKIVEKAKLFDTSELIIYSRDHTDIHKILEENSHSQKLTWGKNPSSNIVITETKSKSHQTILSLSFNGQNFNLNIPFFQKHLIENCMHVISYLLQLKWNSKDIQNAILDFENIPNRLELIEGNNNSIIINDSYSADVASFQLALEYLEQHSSDKKRVLIITELEDQNDPDKIYNKLSSLIKQKGISEIIGIGFSTETKKYFENENFIPYKDSDTCIYKHDFTRLSNSCILIKGASKHKLENLSDYLSKQVHQTILETDYNAIAHNLNIYRSMLKKETLVMAIIKAEAYGSGSIPMAQFFAKKQIDYLGVALIDEAIKIRQSGVKTPIMIFNVQQNNLDLLWEYNLEPEIYSITLLNAIIEKSNSINKPLNIHIKVDTGMKRLGFEENEIDKLVQQIRKSKNLIVKSIFSHLSSSENSELDSYTDNQIKLFEDLSNKIMSHLENKPLRHILNTGGIVRFPKFQFDMVRLGLGLYGIDETDLIQNELAGAHTLKAKILQIKKLNPGEATGYNRQGITKNEKKIAVISIGYADGFFRYAGNGRYSVLIDGQECLTIGNICMDVSMVDITHLNEVKEGDNVIIFSKERSIKYLAKSCNTISYEIISRIAPRVKRTYIYN